MDAAKLIALYVDALTAYGIKAPKRVVGAIAKQVKALLDEGQPPDHIALGLRLMADKGEQPATLPLMLVAAVRKVERAAIADFFTEYGWPTGCRFTRSFAAGAHVRDPLGTARPPEHWPHEKPSRQEVEDALKSLDAIGHFMRGGKCSGTSATAQAVGGSSSNGSAASGAAGARAGSSTTSSTRASTRRARSGGSIR